jgi:hypothetical protein
MPLVLSPPAILQVLDHAYVMTLGASKNPLEMSDFSCYGPITGGWPHICQTEGIEDA